MNPHSFPIYRHRLIYDRTFDAPEDGGRRITVTQVSERNSGQTNPTGQRILSLYWLSSLILGPQLARKRVFAAPDLGGSLATAVLALEQGNEGITPPPS